MGDESGLYGAANSSCAQRPVIYLYTCQCRGKQKGKNKVSMLDNVYCLINNAV